MIIYWGAQQPVGSAGNLLQWEFLLGMMTPEEWAAYNMFIVF